MLRLLHSGVLLLAAAWRFQDPRARLVLALTIIPNRLWFYDQLLRGRRLKQTLAELEGI